MQQQYPLYQPMQQQSSSYQQSPSYQQMQQMQPMQQQYQIPSNEELMRMEKETAKKIQDQNELEKYYNQIYVQLERLLNTNAQNTKAYIDPFQLGYIMKDTNNSIPREKMGMFFKHLLLYTYTAKATEIENHMEVNKHLEEIKILLKDLIKKDKIVNEESSSDGKKIDP
jgi:hypothetical protein